MALPRLTAQQIKEDPEQQLKIFKKSKDFLIAIDTDGCITEWQANAHFSPTVYGVLPVMGY